VKEVVAAAHEAWSEEYEEQAATFASNVKEEAVWRGASGLGGAVMEAADARWKVAARVRKVWRNDCECMIGCWCSKSAMKLVCSTSLMAESTEKTAARIKFIEGEKEDTKQIVQQLLRKLR
jgi:hypothetical protein